MASTEKKNESFKSMLKKVCSSITVEPVLLLYSFAYFLYYTTLQDLVYTKVCLNNFNDTEFCTNNATAKDNKANQTESSHWIMYVTIIYLTLASFVTLYTGSWGDRFGRKIPVLTAPIGFIFCCIGCTLFSIYMTQLPVWLLLITSFFSGIGGGELTIIAACNSYVSHISTPESRIFRLAFLEAMLTIGAILGPLVTGIMTKQIGHYSVFIVATALTLLCLLYITIFVKNTERRKTDKKYHVLSLVHVKDSFVTLFRARPNTSKRLYIIICLLIIVTTFYYPGVLIAIQYLYVKDTPLLWGFEKYTHLSSVKHALTAVNIAIVLPVLHKYFKFSDTTIGIIGACGAVLSSSIYGISTKDYLVYLAVIPGAIFIFDVIASRSIISKSVDEDEKGKVFAVASILQYGTISISLVNANLLWPITRSFFKGFIFETAAGLACVSLACIVFLHIKMKKSSGPWKYIDGEAEESGEMKTNVENS